MNLRRKMMLALSLIVFGALILLLAIGSFVIRSQTGKMAPVRQMLNEDVFGVKDVLEEFEAEEAVWEQMNEKLQESGFQLFVMQEEQLVYSSTEDAELVDLAMTFDWLEGEVSTYSFQGATIIGSKFGNYTIFAMMHDMISWDLAKQNQTQNILIPFIIAGVAAIALILLIMQFLTHYLTQQMMRPVNALEQAAKRIENGELTQPVDYGGKDQEFVTVCNAFNHMQTHLKEEKDKNAAYERARTDMISGISHDLRTPLTSMKGYIKGILDGVAATPEKQEQYLNIAYRKACDMDVLLQKLFYFSKMETGKLPLRQESIDMGEFLTSLKRSMDEEMQQKDSAVKLEIIPGNLKADIDEEQMLRVFMNLWENTQKYALAQPLEVSLKVWEENQNIHLIYADNGCGVPKEKLKYLFEQFWREDESRSSQNEKGSGLGLYIVKHIIEAHRGEIRAQNDHGLQFYMILPGRGRFDE